MATLQLDLGLTISCSVLFIPACMIIAGLRFYTRKKQRASLSLDDWLMIPALILIIAMQVTMIIEVRHRLIGYPTPGFVPGKPEARSNLPFWPFELEQVPAIGFIKLSFIYFYRRAFTTHVSPWFSRLTTTMIMLIIAWTVSYFTSFMFICGGHPGNYWKSAAVEKATCLETQKLHLSFSITDTIMDLIIMVIPIPMVWRLQISFSRKLAVTGIFSIGLITVAASITRMVIFIQATALRYDAGLDFEYLITSCMYWSMIEVGLGFIAGNLIIVYGLLKDHHVLQTVLESLRSISSSISLSIASQYSRSTQGQRDDTLHSDDEKWPGYHVAGESSFAKAAREESLAEGDIGQNEIHLTHTVKSAEDRV